LVKVRKRSNLIFLASERAAQVNIGALTAELL